MTTASKCLVIITTVASLVFFTFISVGTFAGSNYADQMREKDISSVYVFKTETTDAGDSHSVETRRMYPAPTTRGAPPLFLKEQVVSNTPILPKVVLETRKHLIQKQNDELVEIEKTIITLTQLRTQTDTAKKSDLAALESRLEELSKLLAVKLNEQIKLTEEAERVALDTVKTQKEADNRRQEGSQVDHQRKEILTDLDRIGEQIEELEVFLVRLTGTVARLEKRGQQLVARGAKIEKPIAAETKTKSKSVGER